MREVDIPIPSTTSTTAIKKAVIRGCSALSLKITVTTSLASYPGCTHWHIKKPGEKGVLELTTWPEKRPLWAKIHSGRTAPWIDEALRELGDLIYRDVNR
jgi:hypothetical protein